VEVEFINAGHLLGSAFARVQLGGTKTILFGGDLGRYGRPILPDPVPVRAADALLLESTYGDRLHEPDDEGEPLAVIVNETVGRGGRLLIPSFAIGRVEEVLYWLKHLEDRGRIPTLPVYIDSPMAAHALDFYRNRLTELDSELQAVNLGERAVGGFYTSRTTTVASAEQSRELVESRVAAVVIASSGMATGGRVLDHLETVLPDPRNTVLFVGYQAPGTRGRRLCDGESAVKLHGRMVRVAARIERLDSMSAHADRDEILRWLGGFERPPAMTYLVHGEPAALDALAKRIAADRGWPTHIAQYLERVRVDLG
jgi:metallo-beta-lactamase family protein